MRLSLSLAAFSVRLARFLGFLGHAMKLRTLIFWPHLIAGVTAGLVILVMSVTGVLLTYERQLIAWSDASYRSTPPASNASRLPVEELLRAVPRDHPDLAPTAITIGSAADAPVVLAIQQRNLYVDAYSARVLGEGSQSVRRVMSRLRAWHRWLAIDGEGRPIARAITGWSSLLFLFIVVSGIYLWFPRRWSWQRVRPVVWFSGATGKARDFNWHNTIGVWSAIPLFIVVLSALPISFPWANALVYRIAGEAPPAARGRQGESGGREGGRREGGGGESSGGRSGGRHDDAIAVDGLNAAWSVAEARVPVWRTITLRLPQSDRAPLVFSIDRGDGGQPQLRSTLTLDRDTREIVSHETFDTQGPGRRLRSISRFAHTGEVLGIPGQTIAGLASAGAVFLVWTGLALAYRRLRAWTKRRVVDRAEPAASQISAA
jgi:uncharacterized iron-regulated membrane protein